MKKIAFLLLLAPIIFSCDDDAKEYNFKDQDLSGEIADEYWTYGDGHAEIDGDNLSITLLAAHKGLTGCEALKIGNTVSFQCPNAAGVYELSLKQMVTLFSLSESTYFSTTSGAVEILSITETSVSGRINAHDHKKEYFVNGNFTIERCGN